MNLPSVPESTSRAIREVSNDAAGSTRESVGAEQSRGIEQARGLMAGSGGLDLGGPQNPALSDAIKRKFSAEGNMGLERAGLTARANTSDQFIRKLNTASTLAGEEQRINFERALLKRKMKQAKKAARGQLVGNVLGIVGAVAGGVIGTFAAPGAGTAAGAAIGAQAGMALGSGVGNAIGGS